MKRIVFDTNTWFYLIENFESDFLEILWKKINSKEITFIIPENVQLEFNKKIKVIRNKTIDKDVFSSAEVDSIISGIQQIFEISIHLKANSENITEWINSGTAPNHNATNYEDTAILNTLLTLDKGSTFYFVSKDSDFRVSKNHFEIHPDIRSKFEKKGIDLHFHVDFKKLFGKENLFTRTDSQNYNELYDWTVAKLKVSNKNIFEKLVLSIEHYFRELNFIPLSYLSNLYPFNIHSGNECYFINDTLVINNPELIDFFEQSLIFSKTKKTKIKKSYFNSKDEINQYNEILNTLNQNLIFKIQYENKKINIDLEKKTHNNCSCYECTFGRYEAKSLIDKIKSDDDNSPKKMLKKAFYYYKSENFFESLELIKKILTTTKKNEYPIIHSIAEYNKDILRKTWFSRDTRFSEEIDKLKPKNEKKLLKDGLLPITGYIQYTKYFDYKFYDLIEDYKTVKERRKIHQGLGHSFSSNIENKNIFRWAEFQNFISKNSILFEYYANAGRFAMYTFDLCLHATEDKRVNYKFPRYILCKTMPFIKLKDYEKMFASLAITKINYDKKSNRYLFDFFLSKVNSFYDNLGKLNIDFLKKHIREIKKVIFLQSYLSFSKKQDEIIINSLLKLIESKQDITKELISCLRYVTDRKLKRLNKEIANRIVKIISNSDIDFDIDLKSLFKLCKTFKIELPQRKYNSLLDDNIYELTSFYKAYVFLNLYEIGTVEQKQKVLRKVHRTLKNVETFNYRLYFYFVYEKIFSLNDLYLANFKNKLDQKISLHEENFFGRTYEKEIKRIELLDEFISHIYLYYYEDRQLHLEPYLNHSDYYNFLMTPNTIGKHRIKIEWFYIAYNNSPYAIRKILDNNPQINSYLAKKISFSFNEKYWRAFLDVKNLKI